MLTGIVQHRERIIHKLVQIALAISLASYLTVLLVQITGHDRLFGLATLLDVDQEQSISTWFQVLLLAACSAGLWACGQREVAATPRRDWRIWSGIVLAMSVDEQVGLHERLALPKHVLGEYSAFHEYSWIVAGVLGAALIAALVGRFVFELPAPQRARFIAAAALYLSGAIGLEAAAGAWSVLHLPHDAVYAILPTLEELLEMAGAITLLDATFQVLTTPIDAT